MSSVSREQSLLADLKRQRLSVNEALYHADFARARLLQEGYNILRAQVDELRLRYSVPPLFVELPCVFLRTERRRES